MLYLRGIEDFKHVKVNFTLEETMKAYRGIEVQLYSFFNLGARWGGL